VPEGFAFDTAALERALLEKAAALTASAKAEELALAEDIAHRARELLAPHRKTGETEASVRVEHGEDGAEVHADNHYLEFGTSRQKPAPFMRPAIAEAKGKFRHPHF